MKHTHIYLLTLLLALLFIVGCDKDDTPNFGETILTEQKTYIDVSYGKDILQKMDIHLPANRSPQTTEVIILIHGGAWIKGNKEEMNEFVKEIKQQMGNKYAIVNMNYRTVNPLGPRYMLPTQPDDINNMINFVEKNAQELGVKARFVPMGVSAGGHLAMLYSYKHDSKKRVKAIINIVGPSDLSDSFYTNDPLFNLGMRYIAKDNDIPSRYTAAEFASPITWVSSSSQPTISFYGELDHLIPESQQIKLEAELNKHGVDNEKVTYNMGHLFYEKIEDAVDDIVTKAKVFIDKY